VTNDRHAGKAVNSSQNAVFWPSDGGYRHLVVEGPLIAGQYRLVEEIGRGGFGMVWHARDERLDRDVAAKQLFLPMYLTQDQRRERHHRSMREARSAARLDDPGAVRVYDVVEHDGCPWIIMELIIGRSLDSIVKAEGPVTPLLAAEIGRTIVQALRAAHEARVIHRDVKPANVLIGEDRIVLTDFGIAMIEGDPSLTETGLVMGAPAYTSPERARGDAAVPASDLWSLGATLYYAVEGHRPFTGPNANAVFHAILTEEPPPARHGGPLGVVIEGLLRKDPDERLTAEETGDLLDEILADPGGLTARPVLVVPKEQPKPDKPPAPRRSKRRILMLAAPLAGLIALSAMLWSNAAGGSPRSAPSSARPAPTPTSAAPQPVDTIPTANGGSALAFSPDGGTLAIGGDRGDLRLWNVRRHQLIARLTGHQYQLFAVAFSPDGKLLASSGYDGRILFWRVADHAKIGEADTSATTTTSLSFSPDGRRLAASGDDEVQVWDVAKRSRIRNIPVGADRITKTVFEPDGSLAIAGTSMVRVLSQDLSSQRRIGKTGSTINSMAVSPDGRILACADATGRVRMWKTDPPGPLTTLTGSGGVVNAVAFSRDGTLVATTDDKAVNLWDTRTQRRVARLTPKIGLLDAVRFDPTGTLLAVGSDADVRILRLGTP
jgi:serine/threonine protein kinase